MKRIWTFVACTALLGACQDNPAGAPHQGTPSYTLAGAVEVDPALTEALATASATDQLEVIVGFDRALTSTETLGTAIQQLDAGVIGFKHLPMLAALATPAQITAIQSLAGVTSIHLDVPQRPLNMEGTGSVQADDVWALGYDGVIGVAAGCKLARGADGNLLAQGDPRWTGRCPEDNRGRVLASFSSRGANPANFPSYFEAGYHPDITAPGVYTVSARSKTGTAMNALDLASDAATCYIDAGHVPYYTCASGTSMASPHVAGIVALMEQATGGRLTPDQALEVLTRTARPLPNYARWEVGAGYADALAAVRALTN